MKEQNTENTKDSFEGEPSQNLITERQFLDVICRDYTSVHYADLRNDIAEPLKVALSGNAIKMDRIRVREKIGYTDTVKGYCDHFVAGVMVLWVLRGAYGVMFEETLVTVRGSYYCEKCIC